MHGDDTTQAKRCTSCGEVKPLTDYAAMKRSPSGRAARCKACGAAYGREYRQRRKSGDPMLGRNLKSAESLAAGEKPCSSCGLVKPLEAYYSDPKAGDGRTVNCRDCRKRMAKKWRDQYPERAKAAGDRWRDANREHLRERCRCYFERTKDQNRERRNAYLRAYRAANPERTAEKLRAYAARYPEKRLARTALRRARIKSTPVCDLTAAQWKESKAAYGHCCAYCGKPSKRLTMDHVIPLADGGSHTAGNIVPACKSCNSQKFTGPAPTYQPVLLVVAEAKGARP